MCGSLSQANGVRRVSCYYHSLNYYWNVLFENQWTYIIQLKNHVFHDFIKDTCTSIELPPEQRDLMPFQINENNGNNNDVYNKMYGLWLGHKRVITFWMVMVIGPKGYVD